jgi:hypothetical protein
MHGMKNQWSGTRDEGLGKVKALDPRLRGDEAMNTAILKRRHSRGCGSPVPYCISLCVLCALCGYLCFVLKQQVLATRFQYLEKHTYILATRASYLVPIF